MPTKEPQDDKCGAQVRDYTVPDDWDQDDGYCANRAGFRTDHVGDGKCYLHGGCSRSANKGNNHAEKHGLYADRQNYYKNRSTQEQYWIDSVVESLLDDAPFSADNFAKMQMLRNIAIDMHKMQNANDFIDKAGLVQEDKVVGYADNGKPIKEDQENPINVTYDRLNRTMTRQMKELGILDDPESQKAEQTGNLANELSQLRQERSN
jgi:hypothetical protein